MRLGLVMAVLLTGLAHGIDLGKDLLEYVQREYGNAAKQRLTDWDELIEQHRDVTETEQVLAVNHFFNKREFVWDIDHWGLRDYWATPVEFLATDAGDCEEFANAKYMTLRAMGVPEKRLRITYVDAIHLEQAHMVLAWYPDPNAEPLILDNLVNQIQPASRRTDLKPVYSFNGTDLWLSRDERSDRRVGSADEVQQWRHLRDRMLSITGD
ncbi:transglutaminase-like cysteine peptidase [Salicola sp. Rm-C-2C1-2]|uniref:transglutaminase-like cysteine peptidase n=1 Tax=Salicola sp. Rm-C-2C1-2 TaxID=3141321 RepID=UPI0032E41FB8